MRFNVADVAGRKHGVAQRRAKECFLRQSIRSGQYGRFPIVVHRRAANHAANTIPILKRVRQSLQNDDAAAFSRHKTIGAGIECLALPVARQHSPL